MLLIGQLRTLNFDKDQVMRMNILQNKIILVTGASSGIGRSIVMKLAEKGAIPIMIARSSDKLEEIKQQINSLYGMESYYYVVDMLDQNKYESILDNIKISHPTIDGIINNAGFGKFEKLEQMDFNTSKNMIHLNLQSLIYTTYTLLPILKKQPNAHIVNIGSQAGKLATPKSAVYSATKAAVISFSNALRLELIEDNVYVTSVNIGPVKTEFFEHADPTGNYSRNIEKYMLDPDKLAKKIVGSLFTRKREINLPQWMQFGAICYQLAPNTMEKLLKKQFSKK
jgi:uncharacterized protein